MVVAVQINRGNLVGDTWSSVGSSAPAAGLSFGSDPWGFPGQGVLVSHGPSGTFSLAPSLLSRSNNPSWAYWILEGFTVLSPCLCLQVCLVFVALGAAPCTAVLPLSLVQHVRVLIFLASGVGACLEFVTCCEHRLCKHINLFNREESIYKNA